MACIRERRGRWVVDFRDQDGRRHWKSFRTKRLAEDELTELRKQVKDGAYIDPAKIPTFAEIAKSWLEGKRDRAPGTWEGYRGHVENHLLPEFGTLRVDQMTAHRIEAFRNAKRDGTGGHERMARNSVNKLLQTTTQILDYALKHKYIRENAGRLVERVRVKRRAGAATVDSVDPRAVLTADQAALVIEAARPGLYRSFIKTALLTGARSGELLALTWGHVDLEAGKLRIERSLSRVRGEERGYGKSRPFFGPTKTPSSVRTLDLAPDLARELRAWKMQSAFKADTDLVFGNSLGKPLHRAFLHKGLRQAIKKANETVRGTIPWVDLHGLRHSFASVLLWLGQPVTHVSRLLGHENPGVTLKVYSHWLRAESSAPAMAELASALGGGSRTVAARSKASGTVG